MEARLQELVQFISFHPSIETEEVTKAALELLELSESVNHKEGEMVAKWALAIQKFSKGSFHEAELLLEDSLSLAELLNNSKFKGRALSALGGIYCRKDQFTLSLEYLMKALEFIDPFWEGSTYNTIGVIYRNQNNLERSEFYFKKAIQKAKRVKNDTLLVSVILNYCNILVKSNAFEEALLLTEEAIKNCQAQNYARGEAYGWSYLRKIYGKLNDFPKAIECNEQLINLSKDNGLNFILTRGYNDLGLLYIQNKQEKKGIAALEQCLQLSIEFEFNKLKADVCKDLAAIHKKRGNYKEALRMQEIGLTVYRNIVEEEESENLRKKFSDQEAQIRLLEKQKDKIAQQNRALREYAYIVAHDLKEPLRNISSFAALLRRKLNASIEDDVKDYLDFVEHNSQYLYRQLEDLLLYATLDEKAPEVAPQNLNDIVQNIQHSLAQTLESTSAHLKISALPTINGNKIHFQQIFQNLIQNALKFRAASRAPTIEVNVRDSDQHYEFFVKDNGIGIAPNYHENIFRIFQRLDKQNYSGTGIGLALCKKVVELYDGNIWLESTPGMGTTFFFTIHKGGLQPIVE
ncbi:MAG: ATP-binding protein [Bacteroidota bacterium]